MPHPFTETLRTYIRAAYPILYVVTAEEDRAIDLIHAAVRDSDTLSRKLYVWSVARGLCTPDAKPVDRKTADPNRILPYLLEHKDAAVYVLEDFHAFLDERSPTGALAIRQMRDLVTPFKANRKTAIILSSVLRIPPELEKDITVLDLELPTEAEQAATLEETIEQMKDNPRVEIRLGPGDREKIVRALNGLTRSEAENALAKVIVTHSRLDPQDIDLLLSEKEQIVRKSGMLDFYSTPEKFGSIGGLDQIKQWLRGRGRAFSEAARQFGLPNPRGLLLVGVPGCGKSLTAKAVAAEWKMPLLKFDLGKVFGGLVGQSEENMRRATKMAEAVAPCILWIDEIEKGLAGSRGNSGDSGTSTRVFGTLLTWMEENEKQVFTIATANDIEGLPPELLRKGRFDEIFFIDLPSAQERANILAIHLAKHQRDYRDFNLPEHALAAEEFSGAELEQAVISALYQAFAEGESTRLEDRHLRQAIESTRPLAKSMGARMGYLREQAKHWRPASGPATGGHVDEAAIAQPPAAPNRGKRVFEV